MSLLPQPQNGAGIVAKSCEKQTAMRAESLAALGAQARRRSCTGAPAGFLSDPPPPVKKVLAGRLLTACPPLCRIFSPPAVFSPACSPALSRSVVPPPRVLYFCTGPGSAPDTICGFLPGGLPSPTHPFSPDGRSTNGRPSGREPQERRYRCPERVSPLMS